VTRHASSSAQQPRPTSKRRRSGTNCARPAWGPTFFEPSMFVSNRSADVRKVSSRSTRALAGRASTIPVRRIFRFGGYRYPDRRVYAREERSADLAATCRPLTSGYRGRRPDGAWSCSKARRRPRDEWWPRCERSSGGRGRGTMMTLTRPLAWRSHSASCRWDRARPRRSRPRGCPK